MQLDAKNICTTHHHLALNNLRQLALKLRHVALHTPLTAGCHESFPPLTAGSLTYLRQLALKLRHVALHHRQLALAACQLVAPAWVWGVKGG